MYNDKLFFDQVYCIENAHRENNFFSISAFCFCLQAYLKAIQSQKKDLRLALRKGSSELLSSNPPNGRIVHHSTKNRKVIDSEDTKHFSEIQNDGKLITETTKTNTHEEVKIGYPFLN